MARELIAQSKADAQEQIAKLVAECARGISDREGEAVALAKLWSLEPDYVEYVRGLFARARKPEARAQAVADAVAAAAKPEVLGAGPKRRRSLDDPPKAKSTAEVEVGLPSEAAQNVSGKENYAAELGAAINGRRAEPEPEPEPEPEAKAGLPAVIPPAPAPSNWDAAIAAMNEQHAIIESWGGKTVIASREPMPIDLNRLMVVPQSKESFLLRYSNRSISIEVPDGRGGTHFVRMPLGQWWLSHRDRLQFRGVTFRPAGPKVVNECLNLWQGWGVVPMPGDWGLIRQHIEEVVAGDNDEFAEYVRWFAWAIQNPAAQAEVALVLIGAKGACKGTLVRCLQRIFGAHAFQVTSREEVIGKFNGHLQDCILFIADEAYWGGDKRCVGRLQGMITEATLPIERKGIDLIQVPNYLHVVMLAEPGWVIPAGRFERRYAALAVSDRRRGDRAYFKALHN